MRPVLVTTNEEPAYEPDPEPFLSTERYNPPVEAPVPAQAEAAAPVQAAEKSTAFMDMMEAITLVLSARAILLLSLIGAFILAIGAMYDPTMMRLGILCAYSLFAVIPCVWLELRK